MAVGTPTLLISGASDGLCPTAGAERMARECPMHLLTFVELEGATHLLMLEQPDRVLKLIKNQMLLPM